MINTEKKIEKSRSKTFSNRIIVGIAGTGKTILAQREMIYVHENTTDRIVVFSQHIQDYKNFIDEYKAETIKTNDAYEIYNSLISSPKRVICIGYNLLSNDNTILACLTALKSALEDIYKDNEKIWLYVEGDNSIYSDDILSVISDIAKSSKALNCVFTLTAHWFDKLRESRYGKEILKNMPFVTLIPTAIPNVPFSIKCVKEYYGDAFDFDKKVLNELALERKLLNLSPTENKFRVIK